MFSNLGVSMWTMFTMTTLENWIDVTDRVSKSHPGMRIFLVVYVFCTSTALMSLVPAVLLELNQISQKSEEERKAKKIKAELRRANEQALHDLFGVIDSDKSGMVSMKEIMNTLQHDGAMKKLR